MLERREGTGDSKVGLAGEVAMGDGVGREALYLVLKQSNFTLNP